MLSTTQFLYTIENLALYQPQWIHIIIAIIFSIFFIALLRYMFLYHIWFFVVWHEKRAMESKKHVLSDLILMKDIQSEMEKDIEGASLRATFQN